MKLSKKGLTLIEIMTVVIIIAVLAGLVLPRFTMTMERPRALNMLNMVKKVADARDRYAFKNNLSDTNDYSFESLDENFGASSYDSGLKYITRSNATVYYACAGILTAPCALKTTAKGDSYGMLVYTNEDAANAGNAYCLARADATDKTIGRKVCLSFNGVEQPVSLNKVINGTTYRMFKLN